MEELIVELRLFLELLDHEYLTSTVREKKAVITNILLRIQSSKGLEIKEHVQKQEVANSLPAPPQMPLPEIPQQWLVSVIFNYTNIYKRECIYGNLSKGELILMKYPSLYSWVENFVHRDKDHPWRTMFIDLGSTDAAYRARGTGWLMFCLILCYKSSKDQQPQMELFLNDCSITYIPKDSKKKKHELKISHQGADALVLAVQSKEQAEQWLKVIKDVCSNCTGAVDSDGPLSSSPVHKVELEKKLSLERPSSDGEGAVENGITTVCNGKEQVKRKKSSKTEAKGTVTKVTGKKITKIIGLGKKKPSTDEQTSSAEEDVPTCGYLNVLSNNRWRERWCRVKDNKLIFHKDRTDLKTHIVSIPLRGCEVILGLDSKHPLTFRLLRNGQEVAVLEASSSEDMGRWIGILLAETGSSTDPGALHYDYIDVEMTASVIQAAKQTFCFMNRRVVSTSPYRGSAANGYACPSGMALHYDDVPCINGSWEPEDGFPSSRSRNIGEEMLYDNAGLYDNLPSPKIFARYPPADRKANRLSADKLSSNHYKHPVSSNLSSAQSVTNTSAVGRGSGSQFKGKKPPVTANGITGKARTLNSQPKKSETVSCVKRTASNAEQYKYGKNRVEADAKKLQSKEEELLKKKEALRNRLAQLRKERKDLRAAIEVNAGRRKTQVILEDKLKKLEEECKQKEAERVNLELELTEVKESLKKALAGGITLGLAIEPKSGTSSPQSPIFKHRTLENSPISSCDTSDTECSIPVNSAAALKRPPSSNNSPCRGHVLRKAK
ncbi:AFAP1 protein, partial [Calcarius ornatus]|nr:AFAP1 protein [Calcarius ornatus]